MRVPCPSRTAAAVLLLLSTTGALSAHAAPSDKRHPWADDRGTLAWEQGPVEARAAARAAHRLVLLVLGRADDAATQALLTQVLPDARVAARLGAVALGLAADADRAPAEVRLWVQRNLPDGGLPAVGFVTPEGRWITGFRGATDSLTFLQHVRTAEAALRLLHPADRAAEPRAPVEAARPAAQGPSAPRPGDGTELPVPSVRVLTAPAPQRAAIPGLRDTTAEREALPRTLQGSPDGPGSQGAAVSPAGLGAPHSTGPALAAPPAGGLEPEAKRTSSCIVRADARADVAAWHAAAGRWGAVLALARTSDDLRVLALAQQAEAWAQRLLEGAVADAAAGRDGPARAALRSVAAEMAGTAAAVDARRGLEALETLSALAELGEPDGPLARTIRANTLEALRGTRWMRLLRAS